jgi:hypothetical protein
MFRLHESTSSRKNYIGTTELHLVDTWKRIWDNNMQHCTKRRNHLNCKNYACVQEFQHNIGFNIPFRIYGADILSLLCFIYLNYKVSLLICHTILRNRSGFYNMYSKCHVTSNKAKSNLECAEDKFQTRGWVQGCEKWKAASRRLEQGSFNETRGVGERKNEC